RPRRRHAVPRAAPRLPPALRLHLPRHYARRAGSVAAPAEVPVPVKKLFRSGEPFIWLTGGALASSLIIVVGLLALILTSGLGFFWPANVLRMTLRDGTVVTGLVVERERVPGKTGEYRLKVQVANRYLYCADFQWMDAATM